MKLTKKEQLEITAKDLFWKHGFKKVSIDEICKKSNVSRKTFYTFYENKNALVIYLYNKVIEEAYDIYEGVVESDMNFSEKLEKFFNYKLEFTKNISMEFISDFYNPDAGELTTLFNKTIERSMNYVYDSKGYRFVRNTGTYVNVPGCQCTDQAGNAINNLWHHAD